MKLSWLIELIDMNTALGLSDKVSEAGTSKYPQCLLMGPVAYDDTKRALMRLWDQIPPEKRYGGFSMIINGVSIFLDLELSELKIRLIRYDGTSYTVEGTYRP